MTIDPNIMFPGGATTTFHFGQQSAIDGEYVECEVSDPPQVESIDASAVIGDIEHLQQELDDAKARAEQLEAYIHSVAENVVENKAENDRKHSIFDNSFHDLNLRLNIVIISIVTWIVTFVVYVVQK